MLATTGRREEAEQIVRLLKTGTRDGFVPPYNIALVYAGLGDREAALEWLEKARQARDVHMVFLTVDPKWNGLRTEPRFEELLRRCGFIRG